MADTPGAAAATAGEAFTDPNSKLLADIQQRPRQLDRDVALHHTVVRRVLAELDAQGASDVGDVIHSLLWHSTLVSKRAERFAKELRTLKAAAGTEHTKRAASESAPGTLVPPGSRFSPKVGDRFIAAKTNNPKYLIYCEVEEKISANAIRCVVINGGWGLTFDSKGVADPFGAQDPIRVVLLLPKRLRGVRSMDDYERVLAVAAKQMENQAQL